MKVLEFYSGIGGMHYALKESGIVGNVIAAMDINTSANLVYKHNFRDTVLLQRNIKSLTAEELSEFDADMLLMSPPCQPFTRVGLRKDVSDTRTDSFIHIIKLISSINLKLKYILVENVKGFELSETREMLLSCLESKGFKFQEFLLSPSQFGIPNSRLRYYLIAKRKPMQFCFENGKLMEEFPEVPEASTAECQNIVKLLDKYRSCRTSQSEHDQPIHLSHILDTDDEYLNQFSVPKNVLQKRAMLLDLVTPASTRSCCFTKAYSKYAEGTGSVLCPTTQQEIDDVYTKCKEYDQQSPERLQLLMTLRLRYFTPNEISRLMCFPSIFSFPHNTTSKQQYKLLGNSVNVHVVALLLALLVAGEPEMCEEVVMLREENL